MGGKRAGADRGDGGGVPGVVVGCPRGLAPVLRAVEAGVGDPDPDLDLGPGGAVPVHKARALRTVEAGVSDPDLDLGPVVRGGAVPALKARALRGVLVTAGPRVEGGGGDDDGPLAVRAAQSEAEARGAGLDLLIARQEEKPHPCLVNAASSAGVVVVFASIGACLGFLFLVELICPQRLWRGDDVAGMFLPVVRWAAGVDNSSWN